MSDFCHAECGMTRFPPNVEKITVVHESTCIWLITCRNDVELRFPLREADCKHLISLLTLGLADSPDYQSADK
jgi:hypothetical protein